jgi:hypothetical protein
MSVGSGSRRVRALIPTLATAVVLTPSVEGPALWEDENNVVFKPGKSLARGKSYVETLPPRVSPDGSAVVEGSLKLADGVSDAAAEKALSASDGSHSRTHGGERLHRFTVTGLASGPARELAFGRPIDKAQGLVVPIETMNLAAVAVAAARVYGDNMLQYLQVNDLESSRELKRLGEAVWSKKIRLDRKDDWNNRWVRQGLELGALLAEHMDGMSRIRITSRSSTREAGRRGALAPRRRLSRLDEGDAPHRGPARARGTRSDPRRRFGPYRVAEIHDIIEGVI